MRYQYLRITAQLLTLPLLTCCGSYPSKMQAESACWEWRDRGGTVPVEIYSGNDYGETWSPDTVKTFDLRDCKEETETRQFIGLSRKRTQNRVKSTALDSAFTSWQPTAHFRW